MEEKFFKRGRGVIFQENIDFCEQNKIFFKFLIKHFLRLTKVYLSNQLKQLFQGLAAILCEAGPL